MYREKHPARSNHCNATTPASSQDRALVDCNGQDRAYWRIPGSLEWMLTGSTKNYMSHSKDFEVHLHNTSAGFRRVALVRASQSAEVDCRAIYARYGNDRIRRKSRIPARACGCKAFMLPYKLFCKQRPHDPRAWIHTGTRPKSVKGGVPWSQGPALGKHPEQRLKPAEAQHKDDSRHK